MATFEDEVLREIAGCCICDESARSAAQKVAKLVEEKFTSTNMPSTQVAADKFMCTKCGFTGTCQMVTDHKCSEWTQPAHVD